jgi:hypothetical protein
MLQLRNSGQPRRWRLYLDLFPLLLVNVDKRLQELGVPIELIPKKITTQRFIEKTVTILIRHRRPEVKSRRQVNVGG